MKARSATHRGNSYSLNPRRRLLALAIAMVLPAAACGKSDDNSAAAPNSPSAVPSSATSTITPDMPTPTTSHGPSRTRSAAGQLTEFFTAAERMSTQLHRTATLVNSEIGDQTIQFTPNTITAITAIDPHILIRMIPAGMPANLQRQVYLLFSELASRRYAFNPILELSSGAPYARNSAEAARVLEGLAHGAASAARFPADLAATRALASSQPPIPAARPDSKASAEVAIRTAAIIGRNGGCGTSGGWIETTPSPLVWGQGTSGTIGDVQFRADYHPGQGWQVTLNAC